MKPHYKPQRLIVSAVYSFIPFHTSHSSIYPAPKRLNTAIFMYRRTFLSEYAILEEQKMSYRSRNKQVNAIFLFKYFPSSRNLEDKSIIGVPNKVITEVLM